MDDFGNLYADLDFPQFNRGKNNSSSDDSSDEQQLCKIDVGNVVKGGGNESESEDDDEDDDFVVVVNNEDFETKTGGVEGIRVDGEVIRDDMEVDFVANLPGNGVDHGGARLNGGNSQYKYVRQNGAASMSNQMTTRSRRVDREDIGRFETTRSNCGRFEPTYAGSTVLSFGDQGNGFWLPRYRTIFDVDINALEQKPWTHSGADMTDYFNFGFDEDSWKSYCQSLDQLRHQSFTLARNQGYGNLRSNLAEAKKELDSDGLAEQASVASGQRRVSSQELYLTTRLCRQIGQAIQVEDSNAERQPSMDVKPPRFFDPDVVIEINVQEPESEPEPKPEPEPEPEEPSDSLKEPDDKLEAKFEMSEKGFEQEKLLRETQNSGDSKAYELIKYPAEENVSSPTSSSDLRRSHESATVSSGMLEKSCTQTEGPNSVSGTQNSGKVDTFSGGNQRSPNILKDDANSDRDSTETNPCVAGIDLLSDEYIQSSTTSSYSHSEGSNDDDDRDLRKTQNSQSSSPDSVVDRSQVVKFDYQRSRASKRDDTERKSCQKYPSRVRSSIEDPRKHSQRNFRRHSEMKTHNRDDKDYHFDEPNHMHASGQSRLHHQDEKWWQTSDFIDEDWPSYRGSDYSHKRYDRYSMENQLHAECKRDSHRQNDRGSWDDINLNTRRRWDEDQYYSERTRRLRGDVGHREWYREERKLKFRKEEHLFQNLPHSVPKYSSSARMDRQSKYREYHDDYLNKSSKHVLPVEYGYSDYPITDRYADSPLGGRQREYVDSEFEHQRRLKHFRRESGTSDRGDELFEHPSLDIKYHPVIIEDHEYHSRQALPSIHDYHDEQPGYAERWHYSSLSRDDADVNQICHRYERNSRHISAKKSRDGIQPYDNRDVYDREDTRTYLDQEDYFENRRHVNQSEGMDWQEDDLLESKFNYGVDDEMLDSVNAISRHKWNEAKHGFMSNELIIHTKGMTETHGVISAGGKFCDKTSKMPTGDKYERTGLWCRNPVESHKFRKKKLSGNKSKPGSAPNNYGRLHDGRFQKHPKQQQVLDSSFSEKGFASKALEAEESRDRPSVMASCDLEEGQIPIEDQCKENLLTKKFDSVGLGQKHSLKGQTNDSQKCVNQNNSCVYDESRILATMAKMEKRRERFKEPMLVKKDPDSDPKPEVAKLVEKVESIGQRPRRKRQWGGR